MDSACLRKARSLHVVGAKYDKECCSQVLVLTEGIRRSLESDEQRRLREGRSVDRDKLREVFGTTTTDSRESGRRNMQQIFLSLYDDDDDVPLV
jgi:hypothetical protein